MNALLFPRTDPGVAAQVIFAAVVIGAALWRFRDRSEVRLLVIGVGVLLVALIALRAAH